MSERNTRFAGFAKLVLGQLVETDAFDHIDADFLMPRDRAEIELVIAQCVYDQIKEACEAIDAEQSDGRLTVDGMMSVIPDMTACAEEKK